MTPLPPLTAAADLPSQLLGAGWAVLEADAFGGVSAGPDVPDGEATHLQRWAEHWQDLPPDRYLRDGGRYRRRRHGSYVLHADSLRLQPHRAHWQPVEYNALHGGIERWFEPLPPSLAADPDWAALLHRGAQAATGLRGPTAWFIEAHLFRIDTTDGIGRPTPEGAHRDGVDLVVVMLLDRHNVKGGETRVFDANGPLGVRFTLHERGSALLLDDERVIHETTPIQPAGPGPAWRDTLVLTYRRGAFQGPGQR